MHERQIERKRTREMAREFLTVSCTQLRPDAAPTPGQSYVITLHMQPTQLCMYGRTKIVPRP